MRECGFDGVQIHCAHGYCLNDCISEGGIARRFVVDMLREIREDIDSVSQQNKRKFELLVKIPAEENLLDFIKEVGDICDLIELTKGNYSSPNDMVENHASKPAAAFVDDHPELLTLKAKIIVTGGFHTKEEGNAALVSKVTHYVGFGRLYCLPEQTCVERIKFGKAIDSLARAIPLANAGPSTVFYEETLRRRAFGVAKNNKDEYRRINFFWWFICLLLWILGFQRYNTSRDMRKK